MKRKFALLGVACLLVGVAASANAEDDGCSCAAEVAQVASLQASLGAKEQEAEGLQKQIDGLKTELSALTSERSQANAELSGVQSKLKTTQGELSTTQSKLKTTESELTSTQSRLKEAKTMLAEAKKELQAAEQTSKDSVSSCKRTLEKVQSDLSEHAARIAELRSLEDALLPVWLTRLINTVAAHVNKLVQQLQKSDLYSQAVEKMTPHWQKLLTATQPAREAASVYLEKAKDAWAKLPINDAIKTGKQQLHTIEHELHQVVQQFIRSQPSLASLNDPVTIQLLVLSIIGLPVVLLSLLLISLASSPKSSAGTRSRAGNTGAKGTAAGKSRAAAVSHTPAGKGRKGRAIRDGVDVLHTP